MWRILVSLLLIFSFAIKPLCQNRPQEMKYLAEKLRGVWVGEALAQEIKLNIEMNGYWILGGHFIELEFITRRKEKILFLEKFIFGWDTQKKLYRCWYFNSKGEIRESYWKWKGNDFVETTSGGNSLKIGNGGSTLLFTFDGKTRIYRLRQR